MKLRTRKTQNQFAPKNITLSEHRGGKWGKWVWIILGVVLIGVLVAGWQLAQTRLFKIESVQVIQLVGVKPAVVPNDQLQRLASGVQGESLLLLSEKELIDDWLTRMPTLESIYVEKEFPDKLIIQYVPRVAFSQLVSPSSAYLVDRDGYLFAKNEPVDYLPKVMTDQEDVAVGKKTSAKGVRLAQQLIEGLRNTSPRLVNVLLRNGVLEVAMTGDPRLLISESRSARPTLLELETLFAKFAQEEKFPKEVDMRYDRPVLRY